MDLEDILWGLGAIILAVLLFVMVVFIHIDIAKHEENATMLEKYRIEMQYLGEERVIKDE